MAHCWLDGWRCILERGRRIGAILSGFADNGTADHNWVVTLTGVRAGSPGENRANRPVQ
jgi:hypothetical protein